MAVFNGSDKHRTAGRIGALIWPVSGEINMKIKSVLKVMWVFTQHAKNMVDALLC